MDVDPKLQIPVESLAAYLRGLGVGLEEEWAGQLPMVLQFQHGQSNPTYLVEYGGEQLVLRKKPVSVLSQCRCCCIEGCGLQPGKLLPSAHAVEREFRVMKAAQEAGLPVPALLTLCEDERCVDI